MRFAEQAIERLAIYYFSDKDGIVDQYVFAILGELKKNCTELMIVCNGLITPESRMKLENLTLHLFVREDSGFEAWGFKQALESYGEEYLSRFDEVILVTDTVFGPLYPLDDVFSEMSSRDLDFWGITLFNGSNFDPNGFEGSDNYPPYLQTYFLAIRKRMLTSPEFWSFWQNLPTIANRKELISSFAAVFTRYFEEKGFRWQAYVDTQDYLEGSNNPIILSPLELVRNRKCPFIEKESFDANYLYFLKSNNGEATLEVLEFIQRQLNYDDNLIWENLLRTKNMADLHNSLHLTHILSSNTSKPVQRKDVKVALFLHLFFEDLIDECFHYSQSMPEYSDIYITTNTEEKKQAILKIFNQLKCNQLTVTVINNRGRDISALLVAPKSFVMDYDYVCFVHSKKSSHMAAITGASWRYKCFENLLRSKSFVENVITTFEENPRLGILVPPHPSHGDFYSTIGVGEWLGNFEHVVELAGKLGIRVDINPEKEPIAPLGSMFWFRTKALKVLYDYDWDYTDFPDGSMSSDGTLSHAIERIHPFAAQQAGFYPAYLMSDHYARIEDTNLYFMLRKLNKNLFKIYGLNSFNGLMRTIEFSPNKDSEKDQDLGKIFVILLKQRIKSLMPKSTSKLRRR